MLVLLTLLATSVGLAMDSTAVAVSTTLRVPHVGFKHGLVMSVTFGVLQALMPALGYLIGRSGSRYVDRYDHWIIFVILVVIGSKMLWDAVRYDARPAATTEWPHFATVVMLGLATSLDALAVGIGLALLDTPLLLSVTIIGLITFVLSGCGIIFGKRFGPMFGRWADVVGGPMWSVASS